MRRRLSRGPAGCCGRACCLRCGVVAGTQVDVVSDVARLLPADQREVRDLRLCSGRPDVGRRQRDRALGAAARPGRRAWMTPYQSEVLRRHGFSEERPCSRADLCPALSLTNLFGSGRQSARQVEQVIDGAAAVLLAERDHRRPPHGEHRVRHPHDVARQAEGAGRRHARAARPAARRECRARRAARAGGRCPRRARVEPLVALRLPRSWRYSCVLLSAYRRLEAAAVPLIPIALAAGWSCADPVRLADPAQPAVGRRWARS